jgi:small subunit ribosomal protein S17
VSETENESIDEVEETTEPTEAEPTSAAEAEAPTAPAAEAGEPAVPDEAAEEPAPTESEEAESPELTPAAEADAPAAPTKPQPSRRHVPRSERRQRPRKVRERAGERKPVQRQPKPASERGRRQERRGVVVSNAMDKTIVVKVDVLKVHPRYKKVIRRSQNFHAHDEQNQANVGDVVRIIETRPLSKTKNWRLAEVVEAAK